MEYDKYKIDTILLRDFSAKKIVGFQFNGVTILISYKQCKRILSDRIKKIRKSKKSNNWTLERGLPINWDAVYRENEVDSLCRIIVGGMKMHDTLIISQKNCRRIRLSKFFDFDKYIEKGNCSILDEKQTKQYIVLRRTGSYWGGLKAGRGGRTYYLLNSEKCICDAMDWVS